MRPPQGRTRLLAVFATLALAATTLVASARVGADDPPENGGVTTETVVNQVCRVQAPIVGVQEVDQVQTYFTEAPATVEQGETFDIVFRPTLNEIPATEPSPIGTATIIKLQDLLTKYRLPAGVTFNSVSLENPPGVDTGFASPGYYVAPNADPEDENNWQEIPGGVTASFDEETRDLSFELPGVGDPGSNAGEFRGGSKVQPPHIRVSVTAAAPGGSTLVSSLGGTLPSNPSQTPLASTWIDPTFSSTTRVNAPIIGATVTTVYCAPSTPPVLSSTLVAGPAITVASPLEGGQYVLGDEWAVEYSCEDGVDFEVVGCTASVDGNDIPDGGLLDTSSLGAKEFIVAAEGAGGGVATFSVDYDVVENTLPVVDAGADQSGVSTSQTVTLSGTASDSDGPPAQSLTYAWTQVGGDATVTLDDPTSLETTFTAPFDGPDTLVFELAATDSVGGVGTDTVTVDVLANRDPVANAGADQEVAITQVVTLDGTGSSDPDGHPVTYSWTQVDGVPVTLSAPDEAVTTFTAPLSAAETDLLFELTVSDDRGGVGTDTVTIAVQANQPPVANAGPDQSGRQTGQTVNLNGGASADPFGLAITYEWEQVSGVPVTLNDPTAVNPSFVIPPQPDFLYPHAIVLQLTVTDELGLAGAPDTVSINVVATAPTVGTPTFTPGGTTKLQRQDLLWSSSLNNPDGYPVTWQWEMTRDQGNYLPPAGSGGAASAGTFGPLDDPTPKMSLAAVNRSAGGIFSSANGPRVRARVVAQTGSGTLTSGWNEYTGNIVVNSPGSTPVVNTGPYQTVPRGSVVTLPGQVRNAPSGTQVFQWTQTSGAPITIDNPNALVTSFVAPEDLGPIWVQLTMSVGSNNSIPSPLKVTVVPRPPLADAGEDQSGVIVGDAVTLDGTGTEADDETGQTFTYQWTQTGGPAVALTGANTATPSFTAPGGPSTLTFQLRSGASNTPLTTTDTVTVTVDNSDPTADAGANDVATEGLEYQLDGTGSSDPDGNPLGFDWVQTDGPAQTLVGADTATPTFVPTGPGFVTFELTVDDGFGGTDTDTVTIQMLGQPDAVITAAPTGGLAPFIVGVSSAGSTSPNGVPIVLREWDFGNGQTATGVTASTLYDGAPGIYTITLTVTDALGAVGISTQEIQIFELPTASFTTNPPTQGDPPLLVEVDASGSTSPDGTIVSYEWDFGNGDTATGVTASTTYTETNTVATITLTVTDSNGGVDTTTRQLLIGNQLPSASFTFTPTVSVNPQTVNFNGSGSSDVDGTVVGYEWDFGNGDTGTGVNASTNYPDAGSYEVTLTVTDDRGGQGTQTQTVVIGQNQPPVANLQLTSSVGAAPFTLFADGSSSFDVDGTIVSYTFLLQGTTSGGQNVSAGPVTGAATGQTFNLPVTGTYTIFMIVTDDKGVTTQTQDTIQIGLAPQAVFTATPTSGLNPLVVDVDASNSVDLDNEIVSYEWDFGNGDTASGVLASTTYTDPGSYLVTLTITDAIGLTDDATVTIVVSPNQAPVPDLVATPTSGQDPLVVDVDASGSTDDGEIVSYEWDFGNGDAATGATASTTYADPGTYEITLTVTDDKGVSSVATETIEVSLNLAPEAAFTAAPTTGNTPLAVDVDASASTDDNAIVSYQWNFGNGDTATGVVASTTYPVAGSYTITLTVTDDKGLTDTATQTITVGVPPAQRDALSLRITGAFDYEYEGPTIGNELRITRDLFGPLRVRGTETFDSPVAGTASFRATLDRFLIFNAFTGTVRVTDTALGGARNADVLLGGLAQPSATSVRGGATGFTQPFFQGQYNVQFTIDDRSN